MVTTHPRLTTAGWLVTGLSALLIALTAPHADGTVAQLRSEDFPAAVMAAATLTTLVLAGWVLVAAAGGFLHLRTPGMRALMHVGLFTTVVVTAVATPAHAEGSHDLDGLTLPDRPTTASPITASPTATPPPVPTNPAVTIRPGDTLWAIAADHGPPHASPADIARATARWYDRNRQAIGPDPDLIHPGHVLHPPAQEQDAS